MRAYFTITRNGRLIELWARGYLDAAGVPWLEAVEADFCDGDLLDWLTPDERVGAWEALVDMNAAREAVRRCA